jgi:hypothetical protein
VRLPLSYLTSEIVTRPRLTSKHRFELQRRLSADPELSNISVLAMEPGAMATNIATGRAPTSATVKKVMSTVSRATSVVVPNFSLRTPLKSGEHLLRATFDTKALGERPKAVYLDGGKRREPGSEVRDEEKQRRLWGDSVRLAKLEAEETVLRDVVV